MVRLHAAVFPSSGRISMLLFSGHSMELKQIHSAPSGSKHPFHTRPPLLAADWTGMRFRVKDMIADRDEAPPRRPDCVDTNSVAPWIGRGRVE